MPRLFCFGLGYVARRLGRSLLAEGWTVAGTTRDPEKATVLVEEGFEVFRWSDTGLGDAGAALEGSTHWLQSAAPLADGDPVLVRHPKDLAAHQPRPAWIGYLSTTGVYGNTNGEWVDETNEPQPDQERTQRRVNAEREWLQLGEGLGVPTSVFRLGGIYGPGRSALDRVRAGTARRLVKDGKVFNRIHVDDIVRVLRASMDKPTAGGLYNVVDGHPLPPQAPVDKACALLGVPPPPLEAYDADSVSPMLKSFYEGNVRVRSVRLAEELGVELEHKDAVEGLEAVWREEQLD